MTKEVHKQHFRNRNAQWFLLLVFMCFLAAPGIIQLFGANSDVSKFEYRLPHAYPSFPSSRRTLLEYPENLERFFNDSFGLRTWYVVLNNRIRYALRSPGDLKVARGKGDWLFLNHHLSKPGEQSKRFKAAAQVFLRELDEKRAYLNANGIEFAVYIIPHKHSVYPEYLPKQLAPAGSSKIGQFFEASSNVPKLKIIDLRPALLREKTVRDVFYKTDIHWTGAGAFAAYHEIVTQLSKLLSVTPLKREAFNIMREVREGGSQARMLYLSDSIKEAASNYSRKDSRARRLEEKPTYFGRNGHKFNNSALRGPRAFVVGDSFLMGDDIGLMYFFKESFSELTAVPTSGFDNLDVSAIAKAKPDLVMFGILESYLLRLK